MFKSNIDSIFHTYEAIQASICLFSALSDAHALGIGLVDLKLENFLVKSKQYLVLSHDSYIFAIYCRLIHLVLVG
jgi:hypothetical protein